MGRTFPTGVGAPILLEDLQGDREGTTPHRSVIHRFQALLGDFAKGCWDPVVRVQVDG
jgi:hypothetical protein